MKKRDKYFQIASQKLTFDDRGYRKWVRSEKRRLFEPEKTALIITDAWDMHWSRGVVERAEPIITRINVLANHLRKLGVQIVHTPSDVADFYLKTPARQRLLDAPQIDTPPDVECAYAPLPIDDKDGGSETDRDY